MKLNDQQIETLRNVAECSIDNEVELWPIGKLGYRIEYRLPGNFSGGDSHVAFGYLDLIGQLLPHDSLREGSFE